jgi:ankyrin repeat protein
MSQSLESFYKPETKLMIACKNKEALDTIKSLIQKGEDVNAVHGKDFQRAGSPVLRYAIDSEYTDAVKELLSKKANPNVETDSPLITAEKSYSVHSLSLLGHAIKTKAPVKIIEALVNSGANTNSTSSRCKHWTAMNVAEYFKNTEALTYLQTLK